MRGFIRSTSRRAVLEEERRASGDTAASAVIGWNLGCTTTQESRLSLHRSTGEQRSRSALACIAAAPSSVLNASPVRSSAHVLPVGARVVSKVPTRGQRRGKPAAAVMRLARASWSSGVVRDQRDVRIRMATSRSRALTARGRHHPARHRLHDYPTTFGNIGSASADPSADSDAAAGVAARCRPMSANR